MDRGDRTARPSFARTATIRPARCLSRCPEEASLIVSAAAGVCSMQLVSFPRGCVPVARDAGAGDAMGGMTLSGCLSENGRTGAVQHISVPGTLYSPPCH